MYLLLSPPGRKAGLKVKKGGSSGWFRCCGDSFIVVVVPFINQSKAPSRNETHKKLPSSGTFYWTPSHLGVYLARTTRKILLPSPTPWDHFVASINNAICSWGWHSKSKREGPAGGRKTEIVFSLRHLDLHQARNRLSEGRRFYSRILVVGGIRLDCCLLSFPRRMIFQGSSSLLMNGINMVSFY